MAKTPAPLAPAVRYVHAGTGEVTYDVVKTLDGISTILENLTANGHTDLIPMTVKLIYRGKVVETPCEECRYVRPDVTRYLGRSVCPDCW